MRLSHFDDINAYLTRVEPFLLQREAENCLPIGIVTTLRTGERFAVDARPPYLTLVEDDAGRIVTAVIATPPHNVVLTQVDANAEAEAHEFMPVIVRDTLKVMPDMPGVVGPSTLAAQFATQWESLAGGVARVDANERIYRLSEVRHVRHAPGAMRRITEDDRQLLREWLRDFSAEALGVPNDPHLESQIDRRLRFASSGMYLWDTDTGPVSIAGYSGPTPHGIRMGPVYTPPELRGQGYASTLVADLSQLLLDEGRQFVFLFTDLANPTSNLIYMEIGYEPVADVTAYRFMP